MLLCFFIKYTYIEKFCVAIFGKNLAISPGVIIIRSFDKKNTASFLAVCVYTKNGHNLYL